MMMMISEFVATAAPVVQTLAPASVISFRNGAPRVYKKLVARRQKLSRHGRAHDAKSDKSNVHMKPLTNPFLLSSPDHRPSLPFGLYSQPTQPP